MVTKIIQIDVIYSSRLVAEGLGSVSEDAGVPCVK